MVEGFTFFVSYYEGLKQVPEEYRLETYEAIMDYVFEGVEPSDDASPWVQIVFKMAKPTIDSGLTSKENGKKGGAPKGNKNAKKWGTGPIKDQYPICILYQFNITRFHIT